MDMKIKQSKLNGKYKLHREPIESERNIGESFEAYYKRYNQEHPFMRSDVKQEHVYALKGSDARLVII